MTILKFPVEHREFFCLANGEKMLFCFFTKMENQKKTFHEIVMVLVIVIFCVAVFLKTVFF